jgi:LuxR family transcriptional regulator, maltose regulon positive regulatory protein
LPRTHFVDVLLRTPPHSTAKRAIALHAPEVLSERERIVLRYIATSMSYREIATELFISVNTVKSHVKSVIRKMQANSRAEAIARARELRYL